MPWTEISLTFWGSLMGGAITFSFGLLNEWRNQGKTRKQKLRLLLAEIEGNNRSAKDYAIVYNLSGVLLDNKIWEVSKDELFSLPTDLQQNLRKAYSQVTRYNCTVNLHLHKYNESEFGMVIPAEAQRARELLESCEAGLCKYLKIS